MIVPASLDALPTKISRRGNRGRTLRARSCRLTHWTGPLQPAPAPPRPQRGCGRREQIYRRMPWSSIGRPVVQMGRTQMQVLYQEHQYPKLLMAPEQQVIGTFAEAPVRKEEGGMASSGRPSQAHVVRPSYSPPGMHTNNNDV